MNRICAAQSRHRPGALAVAATATALAFAQAPGERSAVPPACDRACLLGFVRDYMDGLGASRPVGPEACAGRALHREQRRDAAGPRRRVGHRHRRRADGTHRGRRAARARPRGSAPSTSTVRRSTSACACGCRTADHRGRDGGRAQRRPAAAVGRLLEARARPGVPARCCTPEQRRPRERLRAVADSYFNTVELNDGIVFAPFHEDCGRIENGILTTRQSAQTGRRRRRELDLAGLRSAVQARHLSHQQAHPRASLPDHRRGARRRRRDRLLRSREQFRPLQADRRPGDARRR